MLKHHFATIIAQLTNQVLKIFPSIGGSSLPGLIALKIDPHYLRNFQTNYPLKTILITGTNGKTTTSRLLSHILTKNQTPHLHNRSGSNLERGVISTLLNNLKTIKTHPQLLLILELDEFAFVKIAKNLNPSFILFTNLFRDQLDRYGEINTILHKWQQTLKKLPQQTQILLNIDDPSLNYLSKFTRSKPITFGLPDSFSQPLSISSSADAIFCPQCLAPLNFSLIFTSHLGNYHCSSCSFKKPAPAHTLKTKNLSKLFGLYNQYNLLAAITLAKSLKISPSIIHSAINSFSPAFGRGETFKLGHLKTRIILVKNPTGFNAALESIKKIKDLKKPLLLILNDKLADGTDVSWIWDVDFNYLKQRNTPIIVSGTRAYDLALRLKYENFPQNKILIIPSIKKALSKLKSQPGNLAYILPTYTAMLKLRNTLRLQKLIHSTWKD